MVYFLLKCICSFNWSVKETKLTKYLQQQQQKIAITWNKGTVTIVFMYLFILNCGRNMLSLHNLNYFMLGSNNTHLFCELTITEVTLTWQHLGKIGICII